MYSSQKPRHMMIFLRQYLYQSLHCNCLVFLLPMYRLHLDDVLVFPTTLTLSFVLRSWPRIKMP